MKKYRFSEQEFWGISPMLDLFDSFQSPVHACVLHVNDGRKIPCEMALHELALWVASKAQARGAEQLLDIKRKWLAGLCSEEEMRVVSKPFVNDLRSLQLIYSDNASRRHAANLACVLSVISPSALCSARGAIRNLCYSYGIGVPLMSAGYLPESVWCCIHAADAYFLKMVGEGGDDEEKHKPTKEVASE